MGGSGRIERELKFRCEDCEVLRRRLASAGAEKRSDSNFEDNLLFDREGELERRGALLRLRREGTGARLTYKGPATFAGGVKEREERETAVGAPEELHAVLERLGFEPVQRYQKYREEWRLGEVVVCLDRTPIGDFVEFEGDSAAEVAELLGLDPARAERLSYLELYEKFRRDNPGASREMTFG